MTLSSHFLSTTGKAGPPGTPEPSAVGRTYIDLKWDPPRNDGGSKITGKFGKSGKYIFKTFNYFFYFIDFKEFLFQHIK